jgi:hypothetical protein
MILHLTSTHARYLKHAATARMRAAPEFPCALPAFLKLLHTVMEPAGLYGSELWGLLSIPGLVT